MFFSARLPTEASLEAFMEVEIPSEDFINLAAPLEDSTVVDSVEGEATAEQQSRGDEIVLTKMAHLRILPDTRTIS